jgi:thioredoxin-like negative regulator of GroEL
MEPGNAQLHGTLAPLLARSGQRFDAWQSFQAAGRLLERDGAMERAERTFREATRQLPRQHETWLALSEFYLRRSDRTRASASLLEGARWLRRGGGGAQGIWLLRRAREMAPNDEELALELARRLARRGQRDEARQILRGLVERTRGRLLRRVRAAQLRLNATPAGAWRWLRAALG